MDEQRQNCQIFQTKVYDPRKNVDSFMMVPSRIIKTLSALCDLYIIELQAWI